MKWHFVYHGYSRTKQIANFYIKFTDSEEVFESLKVTHLAATDFLVFVGGDYYNPGWSGKIN